MYGSHRRNRGSHRTELCSTLHPVDVTADCTLTGGATDGAIALDYASYGALADGTYVVVVNGTSSLDASEQTATVTFTKDTTAPVVVITGIQDSDGDGFVEANENLIISYTVTDANFKQAWVETATNTTNPGMLFLNTAPGNRNLTVSAVDLAGNQGQSARVPPLQQLSRLLQRCLSRHLRRHRSLEDRDLQLLRRRPGDHPDRPEHGDDLPDLRHVHQDDHSGKQCNPRQPEERSRHRRRTACGNQDLRDPHRQPRLRGSDRPTSTTPPS